MKHHFVRRFILTLAAFVLTIALAAQAEDSANSPRQRLLMDQGWKFHLGDEWGLGERLDKAGMTPGPASPSFHDTTWRSLDLPHDWAVELPFDPNADPGHGYKPVGPGFHSNDIGWYRRTFTLPAADQGRRISLEFDGVFRDSRVFFNGYRIGHHESGYSGFRQDVTDLANYGGVNTLVVRVDASQFEGWFYEGAGIYRHVWMVKTAPLAVAPDGIFVYSTFPKNIPQGSAIIHLEAHLNNEQTNGLNAKVNWEILDPNGKTVAHAHKSTDIASWAEGEKVSHTVKISSPILWSPESPQLYKLITTVSDGKNISDRTETEFGIRTMAFDANQGFLLNGHHYELKGTCNHQDHAGVGAALPDAVQYFRVQRLKDMGDNAIRTSHNPPTPELLEACDRLGMLVMDENRLLGSDPVNMDRLRELVCRDRNHASVFIWSLCNEEGVQTTPTAAVVASTMQRAAHALDPTRLCTVAASTGNTFAGINGIIDVRGWNYFIDGVDDYHAKHPQQPEVGTEQASTVCTRGIYANDGTHCYMSAYDVAGTSTAEGWWKVFATRPWLSGGFVWTGFDYRGEPTPYGWPAVSSQFGVMDTCGFPKDNFYYYQAWWSDHPVLHVFPHWNWPGKEGQDIDVRCFGNCDEVELLLNGQSLGRKPMPRDSHLQWNVKYTPGVLLARGFTKGRAVIEDKVETTGPASTITLAPDRSSLNAADEDASVITIAVTDDQGRVVPLAYNMIDLNLTGPGQIIGVGNGSPSSHEPDTYIPSSATRAMVLNDWKILNVSDSHNHPEIQDNFDDSKWNPVNTQSDLGPLTEGQAAVFRTHFHISSDELTSENATLNFGMIDDEGWIYINGKLAGESHDWSSQPAFEIQKYLRAGDNTLAVVVQNHAGSGGVNKGVTLEIQGKPHPIQWKRSVFNGLAQVIVQAGTEPGTLHLTATSAGLKEASVDISTALHSPRPVAP
jgi:beta-galactosidase